MVDMPAPATSAVTPVAPISASTAATQVPTLPFEVSIDALPDKIQQLMRQIQVNATVDQASDGALTLNSNLGNFKVTLPQSLPTVVAQNIDQQLAALVQNQKQLTLVIPPGDPPTQGFLFLPQPPSTAAAPNPGTTPALTNPTAAFAQPAALTPAPAALLAPPVTVGTVLSALVLQPNSVSSLLTLASALPATSSSTPGLDIVNLPSALPAAATAATTSTAITAAPNNVGNAAAPVSSSVTPPQAAPTLTITPITAPSTIATDIANPAAVTISPTTTPLALAPLLQPGSEVDLQVAAVASPDAEAAILTNAAPATTTPLTSAPPANLPTPTGNQIIATVTSIAPNGALLLQAGDAVLYVKQPASIPTGTNLLVSVEQAKGTGAQLLTLPDVQNATNLQAALTAIAQGDPQIAQQIITVQMPQPNDALSGALLLFFSAFKASTPGGWLGEDGVDLLNHTGKAELVARLAGDINGASQGVSDPVVGDWKAYPFPLYNQGQYQILTLYVHGSNDQDNGAPEALHRAQHKRFVIDVSLSKLGALQLDGFIQSKKLDMILRSEHVLPTGLHQELRQIYITALESVTYTGSLNFQVGRQNWMVLRNAKTQSAVMT